MSKRYDKPIPFGWYAVEYTRNLAVGDVKPLHYFGEDLVLFRTESGDAKLLDAYCPHLGAHLGHGGIVKGDNVSCPFHAWEFNGDGYCKNIPYANRVPPRVDGKQAIRSYPVVERNQMIWAWYHPAAAAPSFDVENFPELSSPDWSELETYDWEINTIIQETGENAADIAHFVTVHSAQEMPKGVVTMEGHRRCTVMDSETRAVMDDGSVDTTGANTESARLESWNYGPGQTVQRISRMFDVILMGTVTPINDQRIHLRFNFTVPKNQPDISALYADGLVKEIKRQVEQDIPIWEHKRYLDDPVLCDGDGPINKYRKWFQQFYAAA